jgi:hypothetical protein
MSKHGSAAITNVSAPGSGAAAGGTSSRLTASKPAKKLLAGVPLKKEIDV